jgi:hypothetical protein
MIRPALVRRPALIAFAVVSVVSCGGNSNPPTNPPTTSVPVPAPTPTPVQGGCPVGLGSARYTCQGDLAGLQPRVEAAIDKLVKDQPTLFNLTDDPGGDHRYRILNLDSYYDGVIANLQSGGLCAQRDYLDKDRIAVKENNTYNESYNVVGRQSRIQRGPEMYAGTCTPANFPLNGDASAVARVSVSFFRYTDCPPGTKLPPPHESLPVGCRGTITATPKDSLGNKLPPELHGSDVTWFVQAGEGTVISPGPSPDGVPFNLVLRGVDAGEFSVCATVAGVTGCLNGKVIP